VIGGIEYRVPCETRATRVVVIPAKVGIQSVSGGFARSSEVDSRLRGNDGRRRRGFLGRD
jgi:hypothetical protein